MPLGSDRADYLAKPGQLVNDTPRVSVPTVKPHTAGGIKKYGMWLCCTVMLLPLALYFVQGGTVGGLSSTLGLFAPLLLCVGMHLVVHRLMGRSCHGGTIEKKVEGERERRVFSER